MIAAPIQKKDNGMKFGLIFFSSSEAHFSGDKYRLVIESAKFADSHGFSSVWIPERHFTKDGWLYPNPAVLQAALARETRQIHLRAGSVVMPLHNPLRVAEEWAMVDNLSGGRVGLSFASGWHPNDFVFFPDNYTNRHEEMYRGIQTVQKLWRGETVQLKGGDGKLVEIRTYPTPIQPELPIWITAAGNPKTFIGAGEIGANVLTHMFNQSIEELAEKIQLYRESLVKHGYDYHAGQVSVMLHTFVGNSADAVREQARGAFCEYLKSASYLLNAIAYSRGQQIDLASLSEQDVDDYLYFVFDRLVSTQRVLLGTPDACFEMIAQLRAIGVNEIACQLDFGIDTDVVLASLPYLNQLKELCNSETFVKHSFALVSPQEVSTALENLSNVSVSSREDSSLPGSRLSAPQENPLQDIQARCREEISVPGFYQRLREYAIELGTSFQGIERLWRRDGEALGQVRLCEALEREASFYQIHPALLDACFQVLTAALPDNAISNSKESLYLPTGLHSFQVLHQPDKGIWSHALLKPAPGEAEGIFEGDVRILDEKGLVMVEAFGLRLQRLERSVQRSDQRSFDDWLFELQWQRQMRSEEAASVDLSYSAHPGIWLIFTDRKGIGRELVSLLEAQGERCIQISAGESYNKLNEAHFQIHPERPEDMQKLLDTLLSKDQLICSGIIHLWSLDASPPEETTVHSLKMAQVLGCGSILHLVQSLARLDRREPPRLWLVTQGAQSVRDDLMPLAVAQAPLWGFGRALAQEYSSFWGGLVDLDPRAAESSASLLLMEIRSPDGEDQLAFRQEQRYVARLVRKPEPLDDMRTYRLKPDGSYLITGGLGDLGLLVARWMVKQNARRLILLGRTKLPPRSLWDQTEPGSRLAYQISNIRELEAMGASVYLASVDVADEAEMTSFLEAFRREGQPPIRGVVHTAAEVRGGTLLNLDSAALDAVMRPKMIGGWLLHRLFADTSLDFFVLFSAIPSLLGWFGQGAANYAAANAFLDALAHHRQAQKRPALSINWGPWSQVGLAARAKGGLERLAQEGLGGIPPEDGLEVLGRVLSSDLSQIAVAALNWAQFRLVAPGVAQSPLLSQLALKQTDPLPDLASLNGKESVIHEKLLVAEPPVRQQLLEEYIRERVADVLRLPVSRMDVQESLTALGLDSLMAIELKNRIELDLSVRIPMMAFLQEPSIARFTTQLLDQLTTLTPTASTSPLTVVGSQGKQEGNGVAAVNQENTEQLLAKLDQISDEELDTLLYEMLEQEGNRSPN